MYCSDYSLGQNIKELNLNDSDHSFLVSDFNVILS